MAPFQWSRVFSNLPWFIGLTLLFLSAPSRAAISHFDAESTVGAVSEIAQDDDFDSDSDSDFDSDSDEIPPESKTQIKKPFTGKRPFLLDAHLGMFNVFGFSGVIGARAGYPILHNGFIKSINNAVYIVAGLDMGVTTWYRSIAAFTFAIPVQLNWEFYFTDKWSAFAELGLVFRMTPAFKFQGSRILPFGGWIAGNVGGRFHLNDRIALVLRVGAPATAFGITFKL